MSAPSTPSRHVQGGVDLTDIQKAAARMDALEVEKTGLLALAVAVGEVQDCGHQITEALKRSLRACGILAFGNVDDVATEVTERIKTARRIHEQLATDHAHLLAIQKETLQQTFARQQQQQQQQGTKRDRDAAAFGDTPDRQRVAHGATPGRVSPRTPEPVAEPPRAWRVDLRLPRGLVHSGLRRKLYELAGQHLAYDADIQYVPDDDADGEFTLNSDLRFTAYTEAKEQALRLQGEILECCVKCVPCGNTEWTKAVRCPVLVEHTLQHPIYSFHYTEAHSPSVECRDPEHSEPPPPSSTVVPEERARNEFVVGAESANGMGCSPEACHLLEKQHYSKELYPLIESDYANRIILPHDLHSMFDRTPPVLTFSCVTPSAGLSEVACELTLVAHFVYAANAGWWKRTLKGGQSPAPDEVTFTISHPHPRAFVRYLHLRHAVNCLSMDLKDKVQDKDFISHFNSLKSMTVPRLKAEARKLEVKGYSRMTKDELENVVLHATIHSV